MHLLVAADIFSIPVSYLEAVIAPNQGMTADALLLEDVIGEKMTRLLSLRAYLTLVAARVAGGTDRRMRETRWPIARSPEHPLHRSCPDGCVTRAVVR